MLEIINGFPIPAGAEKKRCIALVVDRATLAKRRWRSVAEDGREFGFDLEHPLKDGATFFETESSRYAIAQKPEAVLELRFAVCGLRKVAEIAWKIGNLHFQIEVAEDVIRVVDDPALRQLFEREGWKYAACEAVFHPLAGGHHH